jgi:hypoxanthine phosphoribosyltransferase
MKIVLTESEIRAGVQRMAQQIAGDFHQRRLVVMGVMTGSVVLLADLIRQIDLPLRVGVVWASSYRGASTERSELAVDLTMMPPGEGEAVLLVDDIFDTGHTLARIVQQLRQTGAHSVHSAVLLRKRGRQQVTLEPDYVGFEIPDAFVVGYGLDYQDQYRHLPYLASLDSEDLTPS